MAGSGIKKKDPAWQHAVLSNPNDPTTVACIFCNKVTKGGIYRHKLHLIGDSKIVTMCLKCPPTVRQEVKDYEEKRKQQKMDCKLPDFADSDNLEAQPLSRKTDSQAALLFQTEPETVVEDPLHKQASEKQKETGLLIKETTSTSKRARPHKVLTDENTKEAFSPVTNQRDEKMNQEPEAILKHSTTNVEENRTLPFAKTSPVWLAVDSMETLKKFPQKPHFAPLNDVGEAHREGLAIGHVVTFSNIVEKASRLHCSDPESSFHECLKTLKDLECHGFDIKPIELHLKKKLSRKEQLEKAKNLEERIKELNQANERIDEELMELSQKRKKNEMKVETLRKNVWSLIC